MSGINHATKWLMVKAIAADPTLSPAAARIAIALLVTFHNIKTGLCNPSYSSVAKAAGTTRRGTAIEAVKQLEEAGWLTVERKAKERLPGVYRLLPDRIELVLKTNQYDRKPGAESGPAAGTENERTGTPSGRTGTQNGPEQAFDPKGSKGFQRAGAGAGARAPRSAQAEDLVAEMLRAGGVADGKADPT